MQKSKGFYRNNFTSIGVSSPPPPPSEHKTRRGFLLLVLGIASLIISYFQENFFIGITLLLLGIIFVAAGVIYAVLKPRKNLATGFEATQPKAPQVVVPAEPVANAKYCSKCGASTPIDAIYCPKCGQKQPET